MVRSKCTPQSTINFTILALIRGSTPLMMWLALLNLHSVGLVVAIKCGITLILFSASAFWYLCQDHDSKLIIMNNLKSKDTYWKVCVIGILQSAVPYSLAIYALKNLPPILLGVFMVTTPWWSALFERIPLIRGSKVNGTVKCGIIFGSIGIIMMLGPIIKESIECAKIDGLTINRTLITLSNNITTHMPSTITDNSLRLYDVCRTPEQIILSVICLFLAPIIWGIVAVFWKFNRKDIHMLVSSVGQNLIGCMAGFMLYFIVEHSSSDKFLDNFSNSKAQMYSSIIFLGVLTGWLATLLLQHLFVTIGSKTTNQVLTTIPFIVFVEDYIFVRDVMTSYPWVISIEVLGVLLVTVGVFVSNMTLTTHPKYRQRSGSDLSKRLLDDNNECDQEGIDDEETTSGFYTSYVGAGDNDYSNYEPPPMVITNDRDVEEEENTGHIDVEETVTNKGGNKS